MNETERLEKIARAARNSAYDENEGDWTETRETILWFATDGAEGKDWGCAH